MIDAVSEKEKEFYEQSKVIMMCGVCGSGKTTYAKKKEQEGYIRLSIDEEMWKLYGRKGIDYPEEQYEKLSEQVEVSRISGAMRRRRKSNFAERGYYTVFKRRK